MTRTAARVLGLCVGLLVAAGSSALRTAPGPERAISAAATVPPLPDPGSAPSVEAAAVSTGAPETSSETATLRVRSRPRPGGPRAARMVLTRGAAGVRQGTICDSLAPSSLDLARFEVEMVPDGVLEVAVPAAEGILARAGRAGSDVPEWLAGIPALKPGETREIELRLPAEPPVLFGEVMDRETREPISGARIEMSGRDELALECPDATTDAHGRFELHLHAAFIAGTVRAARYSPLQFPLRRDRGRRGRPLSLELARTGTLSVELAQSDGRPAVGWNVRAVMDEPSPRFRIAAQATTDSKGECELEGPPSITFQLEVSHGQHLVHRELVTAPPPGERRALAIRLPPPVRLQGRLVNDVGDAIAGESVWLSLGDPDSKDDGVQRAWESRDEVSQPPVITGASGEFTFEDLSPGLWWVGPSLSLARAKGSARGLAPLVQSIRIEAGTSLREMVLIGYRDLFIRGEVLASDGSAARSVPVSAFLHRVPESSGSRERVSHSAWTSTDTQGRFELGPLRAGWYDLSAGDSTSEFSAPTSAKAGGDPIQLQLRRTERQEEPTTAEIRGQVTASGELPEGTTVMFRHTDPSGISSSMLSVSEDGRFVFPNLRPGRHDLRAETPDGELARTSLVLEAGQVVDPLELRLVPGGVLEFEVSGPIQHPWVQVTGPDGDAQCTQMFFRAGISSKCVVGTEPLTVRLVDTAAGRVVQELSVQLRSGEHRRIQLSVDP